MISLPIQCVHILDRSTKAHFDTVALVYNVYKLSTNLIHAQMNAQNIA